MLTSHPSYQQEFGGKKHTRRETRLIDLAGMTAADLSYSMGSERAQSAFWQFGRLFSANNDGADEREISWVSKYMTLGTLLPMAVGNSCCTLISAPIPRNNVEYECRNLCQPIFSKPARTKPS
jgi:hypothetical protein